STISPVPMLGSFLAYRLRPEIGLRIPCGLRWTRMALLELKNLHVSLEDGTEIVKGVDLAVSTNEVHAVMGPNGSGKSTLAYALMGHPAYEITDGELLFDGENLLEMAADERADRKSTRLNSSHVKISYA